MENKVLKGNFLSEFKFNDDEMMVVNGGFSDASTGGDWCGASCDGGDGDACGLGCKSSDISEG